MQVLIALVFLTFIGAPTSLVFHELGHVTGARFIHASRVILMIGEGKTIWKGQFKFITIILRRLYFINSVTQTIPNQPLTKRNIVTISAMGPIFSLLLGVIVYLVYAIFISHIIIYILFLFNIWLGVVNLIPFKIGQKQSDGYTILQAMKVAR